MENFEYKIFLYKDILQRSLPGVRGEEELNKLGENGWELVLIQSSSISMMEDKFYFKKKINTNKI